MEFLFKKRTMIVITILIAICVVASLFYQLLFVNTKEKKMNNAIRNSEIIKYKDSFSDTICEVTTDHGFIKYLFCKYETGVYFGYENNPNKIENDIGEFLRKGETIIKKRAKDTKVYLINGSDSLKLDFEIDRQTAVLINGVVVH